MKQNVLISSAGRRVELVQAFSETVKKILPSAKVICTDINPKLSAACQYADYSFEVPRVSSPDYIDFILNLSKKNAVGLIIPTIDTELMILSQNIKKFEAEGVKIAVSDETFVSHCRDKRLTAKLFNDLKINQPAILDKENLTFPCFCKPYDGSCSKGAMIINSEQDLTTEILDNPKNIFMELIPSTFMEYTIDAYYNYDGILKSFVPRKRLEVRAGEISKGVTRKNFVYEFLLRKIEFLKGARGCITFQFFVNENTTEIKGLEINPRFGGGYPLSHSSGAHFTDWLVNEYMLDKEIVFFDSWEADLTMLRYDAKILVRD